MKKLYILLAISIFASTLYAQDITNTLGTNGEFKINKIDATSLFSLTSKTGALDMHTLRLPNANQISFQILNSAGNPVLSFGDYYNLTSLEGMILGSDAGENWIPSSFAHIQLQSDQQDNKFNMFTYGNSFNNNKIYAYKSRGSRTTPTNVANDDTLLEIKAFGSVSSGVVGSSKLEFKVDGAVTGTNPPGKIQFSTSDGANTEEVRMTIKNDGKVGIATDVPKSTLEVNGSFSLPYRLITANTTLTEADYTVAAATDVTITLPDPVGILGGVYVIKHGGGAGSTTTINSAGSGAASFIDGVASRTLTTAWSAMMVQSTGETWLIIADK